MTHREADLSSGNLSNGPVRELSADECAAIERVLIIQLRPFGDVLLSTGYLPALQHRLPRARLEFLVRRPFDRVLRHHPQVHDVLAEDRPAHWPRGLITPGTMREVRARRYDLVVDQQNGSVSGSYTLFSGARWRLGWSGAKWRRAHNLHADPGPVRYAASAKFDMFRPLGLKERTCSLHYYVSPDADRRVREWLQAEGLEVDRYLLFSPGSPRAFKKWHVEGFARLAASVGAERSLPVVIAWAPGELEDAERMLSLTGGDVRLAPPTDFDEGAALVRQARALVCNDGGLNHLAVAVGTPSLAVFGATDARLWSPASIFPLNVHVQDDEFAASGLPADGTFGVSVDRTLAELRTLLDAADAEVRARQE